MEGSSFQVANSRFKNYIHYVDALKNNTIQYYNSSKKKQRQPINKKSLIIQSC